MIRALLSIQAMPAQPDPLADLADIKLPEPSLFLWPFPPAYWLGLALLCALVGLVIYYFRRKRQLAFIGQWISAVHSFIF